MEITREYLEVKVIAGSDCMEPEDLNEPMIDQMFCVSPDAEALHAWRGGN